VACEDYEQGSGWEMEEVVTDYFKQCHIQNGVYECRLPPYLKYLG